MSLKVRDNRDVVGVAVVVIFLEILWLVNQFGGDVTWWTVAVVVILTILSLTPLAYIHHLLAVGFWMAAAIAVREKFMSGGDIEQFNLQTILEIGSHGVGGAIFVIVVGMFRLGLGVAHTSIMLTGNANTRGHVQGGAEIKGNAQVERKLHSGVPIWIRYTNEKGEETERKIRPSSLITQTNGVLLLKAHCFLRKRSRTFRVDRIQLAHSEDGEIVDFEALT